MGQGVSATELGAIPAKVMSAAMINAKIVCVSMLLSLMLFLEPFNSLDVEMNQSCAKN